MNVRSNNVYTLNIAKMKKNERAPFFDRGELRNCTSNYAGVTDARFFFSYFFHQHNFQFQKKVHGNISVSTIAPTYPSIRNNFF